MVAFQAYDRPLKAVLEFKYLGRVRTASYKDWLEVVGNRRKARRQWARISRILGWEVGDPRTSRNLYKAVVK